MIGKPIGRMWKLLLGVVSVIAMLGLYHFLSERQHRINPDDKTIPDWTQLQEGVQKSVEESRRTGERWLVVDAKATGWRLFLGMLYGTVGAVILGVLMGCFGPIEAFFLPPLALTAKLPPTAMLAVFFVMVGTDTEMFVAMIAFGILPVLAQSVYLSVKEVPEELRFKAYTLGASHLEVIWNVLFRYVFPRLLDAIRLQIGPAMVYLIAAEMVIADVGFGYRIRLQSKLLNMAVVYPYLVILAAFGFLMDFMLTQAQRRMCPWYAKSH
jgi:ABC-type nitrate/sulfonate/bicarbonate transport system permease component